jgi:hypothetical protein
MVIICVYDKINGYRHRKISYDYYLRVAHSSMIIEAWIIPGSMCPDDQLGEPVRRFDETFSAVAVVMEAFFPGK